MARLAIIVAALLLGVALAPGAARAQAEYSWKMASAFPLRLPILTTGAQKFADYVKAASNGRMVIEVVDPGDHKKPRGVFELVAEGSEFKMGFSPALFHIKQEPAFDLFTGIPFGFTPIEHYAWMQAEGDALMKQLFARHGIVAFSLSNTGTQLGGWFKTPIETAADFKGLRMRVAGMGGKVVEAMGGSALNMPGGKIPEAFKEGKIDAAEFVGPAIDDRLKLYDYAANYYVPWNQPSVDQHLFVNKQAYDALPADLKAIIDIAARAAVLDSLANATALNAQAWEKMQAERKIAVKEFSAPIARDMMASTDKILDGIAANNADAKRVIDSYRAFMKQMRGYSALTDAPFLRMRAAQ